MIGITWKRVKGKVGHVPIKKNLEMSCRTCKVSLQLRYSALYPAAYINEQAWKCPRCAEWYKFDVKDEKDDYIEEIIKRRDGKFWYLPKMKEWSADDETARQLTSLGYFGGRSE